MELVAENKALRSIKLNESKMLTLTDNNAAWCEIVVPAGSVPVAKFAATELKTFLEKATGISIPVVTAPNSGKISIVVGDNDLTRQLGVDVKILPRDGFIIKSIDNTIVIAGQDDPKTDPQNAIKHGSMWSQMYERGTLFGVYDFLERFAGVRFYFPGELGTIIPKSTALKIPCMDITEAPDFKTERIYEIYAGKLYDNNPPEYKDTAAKNLHYYRLRMITRVIPNCHGLRSMAYIERFGQSHPEYFALLDNGQRNNNPAVFQSGHLCFSSGIREEIYKDAEAFLTGKAARERGINTAYGWNLSACQPGYFNVMPQDGFIPCHCAECWKHYGKGKQATSDFVWDFMIDTALKLQKNGVPGHLTMLAYSPYKLLPKRPIPDNLLVMVAELGPWGEGNPEQQRKDNQQIKDWVNLTGRKTWLWNYTCKDGGLPKSGIPHSTPKAVGKYYKDMAPWIDGVLMQVAAENYIINCPNIYMLGKVAWDNSTDVGRLLNEQYSLMYGPAAGTMQKIFDRFEDIWLTKIAGRVTDTPTGPVAAPPSEYELWEKIYSPEEIASLNNLFEQSELAASADTAALNRIKFIREQFLSSIIAASKAYRNTKNEQADWIFSVKDVPANNKIIIDGNLSDDAWSNSDVAYLLPYSKGKNIVNTKVRVLKDSKNLYIGFECDEPDLDHVVAAQRKPGDENIYNDSSVEIFLNPSGDRKNYYQFVINKLGCMSSQKGLRNGASSSGDWSWNSDATAAAATGDKKWTVEVAIPLSSLPEYNPKGFPVNFNRNRVLSSGDVVVLYSWSPFLKQGFHDVENFGSVYFGEYRDGSIIGNGDFNVTRHGRDLGKWLAPLPQPGQTLELDTETFINSGKSLKMTSNGNGSFCVTQMLPEMKPDTRYLLTYYIRLENIRAMQPSCGVNVNIWDDKNRWFPYNRLTGTIPWTKQCFEFVSSPGTNSRKGQTCIRLLILNAEGTVWFDDFRLRELK